MSKFETDQEIVWAGNFGDSYSERNSDPRSVIRRVAFFSRALRAAHGVTSICEFGCNIGQNLQALASFGNFTLEGIEINSNAARRAESLGIATIFNESILEVTEQDTKVDLAFTMGVLIHIAPEKLRNAYQNIVKKSMNYILICEYYNPNPVTVEYRGRDGLLFKRDFAGELVDYYDVCLVDYGFVYHKDNLAPMDDMTWFLLQKRTR